MAWQQDTAKPHVSKTTSRGLVLSPLDSAYWLCLKTAIRRKLAKDLDGIKACLFEAFLEIDREVIKKIINLWSDRLHRCIELGGETTEE